MIRASRNGLEGVSGGVGSAKVALTLIACLLHGAVAAETAAAQRGRAEVQEGNRLYQEGRYGEAHEKYLEALRNAPDSPLIRFNDGNALYQTDDFQRALDAYREAIESGEPRLLSEAWYNLGNALYRQQQLQDALEAYKQSLRLDSDDVDAKHNLERVLQQMQEQQQQQQGQEGAAEQDQEQQDQEAQDQQGDQQQEQQQGGQEQRQQQGRQDREPGEGDERRQQQEQDTQPGQMTREEAERLLRAIQEDPEKVQRQRMPSVSTRRPRKDW